MCAWTGGAGLFVHVEVGDVLVKLVFHCVATQVNNLYFYVVGLENIKNLMHVFALILVQHTDCSEHCLKT